MAHHGSRNATCRHCRATKFPTEVADQDATTSTATETVVQEPPVGNEQEVANEGQTVENEAIEAVPAVALTGVRRYYRTNDTLHLIDLGRRSGQKAHLEIPWTAKPSSLTISQARRQTILSATLFRLLLPKCASRQTTQRQLIGLSKDLQYSSRSLR